MSQTGLNPVYNQQACPPAVRQGDDCSWRLGKTARRLQKAGGRAIPASIRRAIWTLVMQNLKTRGIYYYQFGI